MSKKETLKRYVIFFIGLFINSFGVSFVTKANLGTSPISSIPYVLSLHFIPTLGEFTVFFSLVLILLQILILGRRFKTVNLLQIPVSVIFGYFIDLSMALLYRLAPESFFYRTAALIAGCLILGFGVYVEVIADVVMLPGEAFVKAVTLRFNTEFGLTKIFFDASMTLIAGVLSFVLFARLNGAGAGTVIAAFLVGAFARGFGRKLERFSEWLLGETSAASES